MILLQAKNRRARRAWPVRTFFRPPFIGSLRQGQDISGAAECQPTGATFFVDPCTWQVRVQETRMRDPDNEKAIKEFRLTATTNEAHSYTWLVQQVACRNGVLSHGLCLAVVRPSYRKISNKLL
jgi:hypothetical protein